jgi:16S rRNA U516 pseudouridylate synthase RsuA-like enzyme
MTIKFSELLTEKEIEKMYLMTIRNEIKREEIRRLLKGVGILV